MIINGAVHLEALQDHERLTNSNAILGSYGMEQVCPVNEFDIFTAILQVHDLERLFLLGEFAKYTSSETGRVIDILKDRLPENTRARVGSFHSPIAGTGFDAVDLRRTPHLAPVLVSNDVHRGALTTIDGNHRLIAQYLSFGTVAEVPAFLCVHRGIHLWPYVPRFARQYQPDNDVISMPPTHQ